MMQPKQTDWSRYTFVSANLTIGSGSTLSQGSSGIIGLTTQGTAARTYVLASGVSSLTSASDCICIGDNAGHTLTSGNQNTFVGSSAGAAISTTADNTCVGYKAGFANTAAANTFFGSQAGQANITGVRNTFMGYQAGIVNAGANDKDNTFLGYQAGLLANGASIGANTYVGSLAGATPTNASNNTFVGKGADGNAATSGGTIVGAGSYCGNSECVTVGALSGHITQSGQRVTVLGAASGNGLTSDDYTTIVGAQVGNFVNGKTANILIGAFSFGSYFANNGIYIGTSANPIFNGDDNVMMGNAIVASGSANTQMVAIGQGQTCCGDHSVSIGYRAGYSGSAFASGTRCVYLGRLVCGAFISGAATGADNTYIGDSAALDSAASAQNVVIGSTAGGAVSGGVALQSGSNNVLIGYAAAVNAATSASVVVIGKGSRGADSSVIIGVGKTSSTSNDLIIESGEVGIRRNASAIIGFTDGAGGAAAQHFIGAATATFGTSSANNGRIFYNSTLQHFFMSENNGSYVQVGQQNLLVTTQTSAGYTLVLGDAGGWIELSNASTQTLSIPTNASVAFPIGTQITVIQTGAGQWTIQAVDSGTTTVTSTGATSAAPVTRTQNSSVTLVKVATDIWRVVGDIV